MPVLLPEEGDDGFPKWTVSRRDHEITLTPQLTADSAQNFAVFLSRFTKDDYEDLGFTEKGHFWYTPNAHINLLCKALGVPALHVLYNDILGSDVIKEGVQNFLFDRATIGDAILTVSWYGNSKDVDGHIMCIYRKHGHFFCQGVYDIVDITQPEVRNDKYPRFEMLVEAIFPHTEVVNERGDSTWELANVNDRWRWRCTEPGSSTFKENDIVYNSLKPAQPREFITAHRFEHPIFWCSVAADASPRLKAQLSATELKA